MFRNAIATLALFSTLAVGSHAVAGGGTGGTVKIDKFRVPTDVKIVDRRKPNIVMKSAVIREGKGDVIQSVSLHVTLHNPSYVATGAFNLYEYVKINGVADRPFGHKTAVASLKPFETRSVWIQLKTGVGYTGKQTYFVWANANFDRKVKESTFADNSKTYTVKK